MAEIASKNDYKKIDAFDEWMDRVSERKAARYTYFDKQHQIVQADRAEKLTTASLNFQAILMPYVDNASHKSTEKFIVNKTCLKIAPWLEKVNNCLAKANDVTDSNTCMDTLIHTFETEGMVWAKNFARSL